MLGERYGTRPPQSYYDELARDPLAFQFVRGRTARLRARMAAAAANPALSRILGPRDGPVTGDVRIPVVLGLFQDSPDALKFTLSEIERAYFSVAPGTITSYYQEVSGGRVTLLGELHGWVRSSKTRIEATLGQSGIPSGTGPFIVDLLEHVDGVDWGRYDNDGPDGVANSGDDDGFVDALAVIQPTAGAECGGIDQVNRIWSHKWNLGSATGRVFTTDVAAASGGFIKIDDYFVQGIFSCNDEDLAEIGVFTHEAGHAFGLPDLYDTFEGDGKHGGAGNWDLMATGSWGCDGHTPESPCHMGAWSKAVLGWANVTVLSPDTDHGIIVIPPVETSGTIYRIEAGDGSADYFLLENRQRLGFDQMLMGEGLLIWHIDPVVVQANWGWNGVNAFEHMGVWLRQADGFNELGQVGGGRGDPADPFPYLGISGTHDAFHARSNPAARSHAGSATGLTVLDIERSGDDISLRLLTRFSELTVRSIGDAGAGGLLTVDGAPIMAPSHSFQSAPFEEHTLEAAAGEPLGEGRRRAFEGWDDDAAAPRVRSLVTPLTDADFVARYGPLQLELAIETTGGVDGIEPGGFSTQPSSDDLWFEEGVTVVVEAVPQTGFGFLRWTGALMGQPNPATLTMVAPVTAGADFELTYEVPTTTIGFPAATAQGIRLEVENGTAPVFWTLVEGVLPPGISMNTVGQITGAAMELGDYPVTLEARDAIGLTGQGIVTFQVNAPDIGIDRLASDFLSVGPPLDGDQRRFLDGQGNGNGSYDLGDFRAWVLANPQLPLSAALRALIEGPRSIVIPTAPLARGREGGR